MMKFKNVNESKITFDDIDDIEPFDKLKNTDVFKWDVTLTNLKEFERTKLYDIKSAPLLFDKMKKFLNSKGTEVVKKYLIQK